MRAIAVVLGGPPDASAIEQLTRGQSRRFDEILIPTRGDATKPYDASEMRAFRLRGSAPAWKQVSDGEVRSGNARTSIVVLVRLHTGRPLPRGFARKMVYEASARGVAARCVEHDAIAFSPLHLVAGADGDPMPSPASDTPLAQLLEPPSDVTFAAPTFGGNGGAGSAAGKSHSGERHSDERLAVSGDIDASDVLDAVAPDPGWRTLVFCGVFLAATVAAAAGSA